MVQSDVVQSDVLQRVKALTFDLFGTVLDLGGSLTPPIAEFLKSKGSSVDADQFWTHWRARQRIEQHQDTIMMIGHSGYLATARRALVYTLRLNKIEFNDTDVDGVMAAWQNLSPFPEVVAALERLQSRYKLVGLSNGNLHFLEHLAAIRIHWKFDDLISVESVGNFKPHPSVYRYAARRLDLEACECLMVSANSFDILGARACGLRGAFVNRLQLPYDDSPLVPDVTVEDFTQLAEALL